MQPWFREPHSSKISLKLKVKLTDAGQDRKCHDIVPFPWSLETSNSVFFRDTPSTHFDESRWKLYVKKYEHTYIVTDKHSARLIDTNKSTSVYINLPGVGDSRTYKSADFVQATWSMLPPKNGQEIFKPYIVFGYDRLIYVYDVENSKTVNLICGHGGAITFLTTHPIYLHVFCSTSRDFTTRIYALDKLSRQIPDNPPWPPSTEKSYAGAAHGLDMTDPEGLRNGMGGCVLVLVGNGSGGHNGEVLSAAFHPRLPVIATCGMDRAIKIWHVHLYHHILKNRRELRREDKPLFSSSRIHKSRVLSVSWLTDDMLISHSAPAIMRRDSLQLDPTPIYNEPGTICLWTWCSKERFFPSRYENYMQPEFFGCASDYQESSSLAIHKTFTLPKSTDMYAPARVSVSRPPGHDPLLIVTYPNGVERNFQIANISKFAAAAIPPIERVKISTFEKILREQQLPELDAWSISLPSAWFTNGNGKDEERLTFCRFGRDPKTIIGVGGQGSTWVWDILSAY